MTLNRDIKKVLFTEEQIARRTKELGEAITEEYGREGKKPLVVALLRGSVPFFSELIKSIDLDIEYDFMDVTSYAGTKSTGEIRIMKDLETSVVGKDVLIVEDIIDTGRTVAAVKAMLEARKTESVKVVTLLDKPSARIKDIRADYVGFEVANEFVVGFGLDYNQHYRALPYVGVLKDEIYE
jgi:hypoxanthine phosphoribosyltransferase